MSNSVFDGNPPQAPSSDIRLDCPSAMGPGPTSIQNARGLLRELAGQRTQSIGYFMEGGRTAVPSTVELMLAMYLAWPLVMTTVPATASGSPYPTRRALAQRLVESFNGRVCDERLNIDVSWSLTQARVGGQQLEE